MVVTQSMTKKNEKEKNEEEVVRAVCKLMTKYSGKSLQYIEYKASLLSLIGFSKQLIIDIFAHSGVDGLYKYGLECSRNYSGYQCDVPGMSLKTLKK